jgi:hypothetical protein
MRPRLRPVLLAAAIFAAAAAHGEGRVHASAEAVTPLAVGSAVPSVRVRTVGGEPVDLAEQVKEAGALLVFYRGGW